MKRQCIDCSYYERFCNHTMNTNKSDYVPCCSIGIDIQDYVVNGYDKEHLFYCDKSDEEFSEKLKIYKNKKMRGLLATILKTNENNLVLNLLEYIIDESRENEDFMANDVPQLLQDNGLEIKITDKKSKEMEQITTEMFEKYFGKLAE